MLIYKITNLINGKIYIGKHNKNELGNYFGYGVLLNAAIKKYGKNNFKIEILQNNINSVDECNSMEKEYIKEHKSIDKEIGYNITVGGDGGDTYKNNPNAIKIKRRCRRGIIDSYVRRNGKHDEKIPAQEEKLLKFKHKRKTIKKIKESNLRGRGISLTNGEVKRKKKNYIPIGKMSIEHKKALSKSLKEFWKNNYPTNSVKVIINNIKYNSLNEASIELNVNLSTLRNRLKSKNQKFIDWYREDKPKIKADMAV